MSRTGPLIPGPATPEPATMGDVLITQGAARDRPIVGRDEAVMALLSLVESENGKALLLGGDAGVGKTRLLGEVRERLRRRGWQVVTGQCLDFGDSALPYLPFSEIVGHLARSVPELVQSVGSQHPLGRLVPGRRRLGDEDDAHDATRALDGAVDRSELFLGVHTLLDGAASERPLVLIIEDLHWADRSTRDLLRFLLSRPFDERIRILASYRSDDLHRRHPLRAAISEWSRVPGVERLHLEPLTPAASRELIAGSGVRLTAGEADDLVDRSGGNAFFLEELLGAAAARAAGDSARADSPDDLPEDLADALLVRLDRLDTEARRVVQLAAVAGRRASQDLLDAATDLPPDMLDAGLRSALEHHVLVLTKRGNYEFRHALLAEAVYDDLLPGERLRLHQGFAAALAQGRAAGTAAELARHARLSRQWTTALSASIRAGDEALSVGGADEAAHHYEAALEIVVDPWFPEDVTADVSDIAARAVDALIRSGSPHRGRSLAERMLADLPADAPAATRAQLLTVLAHAIFGSESEVRPIDLTREALALLPEDPSPLRARLLGLHARGLNLEHDYAAAREIGGEAIAMSEQLGMTRLNSDVMATMVFSDRFTGLPYEEADAALLEVVDHAAQIGAYSTQVRAWWTLGRWRYERGDIPASREAFLQGQQRGVESDRAWSPYALESLIGVLLADFVLGDWDDLLERGDAAVTLRPPALARAAVQARMLPVLVARGEDSSAITKELRSLWAEDGGIVLTAAPATMAQLAGHDRDGILRELDEAEQLLSRIWQPDFDARVRLTAEMLAALSVGLREESSAERADLVRRVRPYLDSAAIAADRMTSADSVNGPEGRAWVARLRAERLRFHWLAGESGEVDQETLRQAWEDAVAAFAEFGHVYEVARSRAGLAEILRPQGQQHQAVSEAALARAAAEGLGARGLLSTLGAETAQGSGRGTGRTRAATTGALTTRETEILTLVAAGRSNGEIGRSLFISTKTVSAHVSNILAKLGAAGRTEAAAIARRDRLI